MPIDLKKARILISNDDGIDAPGIKLLEKIARELSDDVWVVAPEQEQSGAGHSLTLHEPLRLRKVGERRYAVKGTPTDTVLVAVQEVLKDKKPDLMLSGINRGSNMAEDVTYSGTVSAAMEATLLEIPSIAMSNQIKGEVDWTVPEQYAKQVIQTLAKADIPHDRLINVNFPALPLDAIKGMKLCPQGRRILDDNLDRRIDPAGRPYIWIGGPRTQPFRVHPEADYEQIRDGWITITPISMDMTDYEMLARLSTLVPNS